MHISDAGTLYLRTHVGSIEDGEGNKYDLSLINGHTPAIESSQTGKFFLMEWADIVEFAIKEGIDVANEESAQGAREG